MGGVLQEVSGAVRRHEVVLAQLLLRVQCRLPVQHQQHAVGELEHQLAVRSVLGSRGGLHQQSLVHHLLQLPQVLHWLSVDCFERHVPVVLVADVAPVRQHLRQEDHLLLGLFPERVSHGEHSQLLCPRVEGAHVLDVVLGVQVLPRQGHQHQPPHHQVRGRTGRCVCLRAPHWAGAPLQQRARDEQLRHPERRLQLHRLPCAQDLQSDCVGGESLREVVVELHPLVEAALPEGDRAVVRDLHSVHAQQHVAHLQQRGGGRQLGQPHHQHARLRALAGGPWLRARHAEVRPQLGVVHALQLGAQHAHARVGPVSLHVVQEVIDHGHGHHVAYILHVSLAERLEGGPDYLVVRVHHGPAAVARVDGRVYLDGQQLCGGLSVLLHLDARHHSAADADALSPHGESHHGHVLQQVRQLSELQGRAVQIRPEVIVRHVQHGQVALVPNCAERGGEGGGEGGGEEGGRECVEWGSEVGLRRAPETGACMRRCHVLRSDSSHRLPALSRLSGQSGQSGRAAHSLLTHRPPRSPRTSSRTASSSPAPASRTPPRARW
mmetsp:Transcript_22373/g.49798  ORF Transcript_22373/g.49798 Transcript_22373/m.49798 type:complete len:550 (+) Transcript_22373:203-1852(+)